MKGLKDVYRIILLAMGAQFFCGNLLSIIYAVINTLHGKSGYNYWHYDGSYIFGFLSLVVLFGPMAYPAIGLIAFWCMGQSSRLIIKKSWIALLYVFIVILMSITEARINWFIFLNQFVDYVLIMIVVFCITGLLFLRNRIADEKIKKEIF